MFKTKFIYNFIVNQNQIKRGIKLWPQLTANISFNLSDIGEGIREVVIKEWYVNVGDKVSQFDNICEVQSDKATVTITSRYDGIIKKLYYNVDDMAYVGKPLIDIETEDDDDDGGECETPAAAQPSSTVVDDKEKSDETSVEILSIPSVRRLAQEHKIDLRKVKGTGKNGRILKEDVLKYITPTKETTEQQYEQSVGTVPSDRVVQIKGFQKAMVKTMTSALQIPHFVYCEEIIVTKLSKIRKNLRDENFKVSFMPFFIKATSNALSKYPILNAIVDENCEKITYKGQHNIGVAMDTTEGLAVPVIKNVQQLSIQQINNELKRLIQSGKNGSFTPSDLSGATFTISNIGTIGGTYAKPIILPPQVAIIALGSAKLQPRFDEGGSILAEEIINLSASADHRIVDGATMARFVQLLKKQIENPLTMFFNIV